MFLLLVVLIFHETLNMIFLFNDLKNPTLIHIWKLVSQPRVLEREIFINYNNKVFTSFEKIEKCFIKLEKTQHFLFIQKSLKSQLTFTK